MEDRDEYLSGIFYVPGKSKMGIYAQANVPPFVLGEFINLFPKITFELTEDRAKDVLGRVYEYFIGKFAEAL